jgi:hypothetical protein
VELGLFDCAAGGAGSGGVAGGEEFSGSVEVGEEAEEGEGEIVSIGDLVAEQSRNSALVVLSLVDAPSNAPTSIKGHTDKKSPSRKYGRREYLRANEDYCAIPPRFDEMKKLPSTLRAVYKHPKPLIGIHP